MRNRKDINMKTKPRLLRKSQQAYLWASMAVLCWSTVAVAFKISLRTLTVVQLIFISSGVSAICFLFLLIFEGKVKQLSSLSISSLALSLLLALLNPVIYYLILFSTYKRLPVQIAQPLNYTWPILLSLLSVPFLGQRIQGRKYLGIALAFSGVILISSRGTFSLKGLDITGSLMAMASALFWAVYWIINTRDREDPQIRMFLSFFFGCLLSGILLLFQDGFPMLKLKQWAPAVYVGLFEMGISFFFWNKAMKTGPSAAAVSRLIYFSPFLSLLFVALILGERILFSSFLGLSMIVIGVLL